VKKKIIESFVRYTLIILLIYSFYGLIFLLLSNQKIYFFGQKLTGQISIFYSLIMGVIISVIVYLLFEKKNRGEELALIYFIYSFIDNMITNISLDLGFLSSPLAEMGLMTAIVLLIFREFIYN
jgi:hypothetical protein